MLIIKNKLQNLLVNTRAIHLNKGIVTHSDKGKASAFLFLVLTRQKFYQMNTC